MAIAEIFAHQVGALTVEEVAFDVTTPVQESSAVTAFASFAC